MAVAGLFADKQEMWEPDQFLGMITPDLLEPRIPKRVAVGVYRLTVEETGAEADQADESDSQSEEGGEGETGEGKE